MCLTLSCRASSPTPTYKHTLCTHPPTHVPHLELLRVLPHWPLLVRLVEALEELPLAARHSHVLLPLRQLALLLLGGGGGGRVSGWVVVAGKSLCHTATSCSQCSSSRSSSCKVPGAGLVAVVDVVGGVVMGAVVVMVCAVVVVGGECTCLSGWVGVQGFGVWGRGGSSWML